MKRRLAIWLLRLVGWRPVGTRPEGDHFVLIAAPHTSNWDLPLMLVFGWAFELDVRWLGKKSLFDSPAGRFFRWTGGLPVDRSYSADQTPCSIFYRIESSCNNECKD